MNPIPDIDDGERWVVESALRERYGQRVQTQLADVELRLTPGEPVLTACPTLYWEERGAAFVLTKVAGGRYRAMFFYPGEVGGEQYGAGRPEYDDLSECVLTLLRAQADHEKERHGVASGKTARELEGVGEKELDDAGPSGSDDNELKG
ncbi:MAG: hypothetical protein OEW21_05680 [Betaproteobacteria bacterium]|nr:hypothetical protein [Betaproteobacteria bacterium]